MTNGKSQFPPNPDDTPDITSEFHPQEIPSATILDTPEQIALFRLLQIKYALKVEIRTGLSHSRGSVLKLAQEVLKQEGKCSVTSPPRTKQKAFDLLDQLIGEKTAHLTDDPA